MNRDVDSEDEIAFLYAGNSILHSRSPGQANHMDEERTGSYTCPADHSCTFQDLRVALINCH